jgi:hypothetical protein
MAERKKRVSAQAVETFMARLPVLRVREHAKNEKLDLLP